MKNGVAAPFGDNLTDTGAPGATENEFTGKELDAETGNDYFGARYYNQNLGRFLTPDSLGGHLKNPQTLNKYVYAGNNPLTNTDPTGQDFYPNCDEESPTCGIQQINSDNNAKAIDQPVLGTTDSNGQSTPTNITAQQTNDGTVSVVVHGGGHWLNKLGSWLSNGFTSLSAVFSRSFGSFGGDRAGKPFTRGGRQNVLNDNAAKNGGTNVCENCGQPTIPAQQSQAGVPRPGNESNVDHIYPKSLGGNGSPDNGQTLCATCNGIKSDPLPVMEEPEVMPEVPIEIPF